jgi:hypothetical protein
MDVKMVITAEGRKKGKVIRDNSISTKTKMCEVGGGKFLGDECLMMSVGAKATANFKKLIRQTLKFQARSVSLSSSFSCFYGLHLVHALNFRTKRTQKSNFQII